jgi:hypothetical protein
LAATRPNGEFIKGVTAQGWITKVTPDAVFIRDALANTNGYDKDLVLWVEKDLHK